MEQTEYVAYKTKADAEAWRRKMGHGRVIPMDDVPGKYLTRSRARGDRWAYAYTATVEPFRIPGLNT